MIVKIVKKMPMQDNVIYELIDDPNIVEFGRIMSKTQIENLQKYGNTVISYSVYNSLSEARLKKEITELTGLLRIKFELHEHINSEGVKSVTVIVTAKKKE